MKAFNRLARHDGNTALFDMVEMSIISGVWGVPLHIHAEGLRGTGKTTIMRTAKHILPRIERIKGCLYNCDPQCPHCPQHSGLTAAEIAKLGTEMVPMPFLEISHSAKIATVAGSIDLARITDPTNPTAAILPGIIPQAHRGIIFIDEINRLADTSPEITDVLLDVMGTKPGRIQIEEAGLSHVEIPVQVSVWAASNPDEEPGPLEEIRKQLADRFDLVLYMGRPDSVEIVSNILRQNEIFSLTEGELDQQPTLVCQEEKRYGQQLMRMAEQFKGVTLSDYLRNFVARLYLKYNIESLRAIEAVQQAAVLHSVLRQRNHVMISDVLSVLPLALKHRVDSETLTMIMNNVEGHNVAEPDKSHNVAEPDKNSMDISPISSQPDIISSSTAMVTSNKDTLMMKPVKDIQPESFPLRRKKSFIDRIRAFFSSENNEEQEYELPMPTAKPLRELNKFQQIRTEDDFKEEENK